MNAVTPSRQRPRGLPLSHLFLLITATASLLFIYRAAERVELDRGEISPGRALLDGLAVSVIYGPAVSALVLAIWTWLRRAGWFPDQPGHWLLIAHGCAILIVLYGQVRAKRDPGTDPGGGLPIDARLEGVAFAVAAAVLLAGADRLRSDVAWRNLLAAWGGASLALCVVSLRYSWILERGALWPAELVLWPASMGLIDFVAGAALLGLAVWQRSRWRQQDSWHHLGIIVATLAIALRVPDIWSLLSA